MGGSKKQTVGYRYFMGLHFGLCHGPVDAFTELRGGDRTAWVGHVGQSQRITVDAPELWGGEKKEGGIQGELDVMMGEPDQQPNDYLVSQLGEPMPAFRGMLSLVFRKGMVGAMNPYPKPWKFKVRRVLKGWHDDAPWYPERAPVHLRSFARNVPSRVYFALDCSGSMAGAKIVTLKAAMVEVLNQLEDWVAQTGLNLSIALVPFSSNTGMVMQRDSASGADFHDMREFINSLVASGGTNAMGAFGPLPAFFNGSGVNNVAICVSDGAMSSVAEAVAHIEPTVTGQLVFVRGIGIQTVGSLASFDNSGEAIPVLTGDNAGELANEVMQALARTMSELGMNPAHIAYEALTNPDWGLGYPQGVLDTASFMDAADTFYLEGLGLCGQWTRQDTIEGFIQDVMNHAGAVLAQDPRTGLFRLLPIRGGYDPQALPEFRRGLNVIEVQGFERAAITEAVNEVTVQYNDMVTGNKGSVTVQHLANIQAQGGVASQTVQYPLAPTAGIAQRLALRDLQAKAQPLCKTALLVDRTAYGILPGEVVRWSDHKHGIVDMPMRVLEVNYGSLTSGAIRLSLAEDVFGMPATTYMGQQPDGWEEPDTSAKPSPAVAAIEAPYLVIHRTEGSAAAGAMDPNAGFVGMLAAKPPGLSYGYAIHTRVGAAPFEQTGTGEWAAGGILADAIGLGDTTVTLGGLQVVDEIVPGALAMIGSGADAELVRIDAVNGAELTIGRGVGDTVPRAWEPGTRLWVLDGSVAIASVEFAAGEAVDARATTDAPAGSTPVGSAPGATVTMEARAALPYPPGRLRIEGEAEPEAITGEFTVTWAHRDRLLQADQLVDQEAASVGPEPTTRYALRLLDDADAVLVEKLDIDGTTATVDLAYTGDLTLQLYAISDAGASWQRHVRTFAYTEDGATEDTIDAPTYDPEDNTTIIDGGEVTP